MVSWTDLHARKVSVEDAGPLFAQAGADLDALLASTPQATDHLLAILQKRLGDAITTDTWTGVETGLANYLGAAAQLVSWVTRADQAARLREAEARISPAATALLRTILGFYGRELALAYERWRELPNDWVRMNRDVMYDEIDKRHLIRVSIEKQNGETVVVEARPGSFLRLITTLLRTARHVSLPAAFDAASITSFNEEVGELQRLLAKPADQPPS